MSTIIFRTAYQMRIQPNNRVKGFQTKITLGNLFVLNHIFLAKEKKFCLCIENNLECNLGETLEFFDSVISKTNNNLSRRLKCSCLESGFILGKHFQPRFSVFRHVCSFSHTYTHDLQNQCALYKIVHPNGTLKGLFDFFTDGLSESQ